MLWLGLYLPQLVLEVFQRGEPDPPALAISQHGRIDRANAVARAAGVEIGQARATAFALHPALILQERQLGEEQAALRQVANWAAQFTPGLHLQEPDGQRLDCGLLLDIDASLQLFGGLDRLQSRIREGIEALGFSLQMACAPTPAAAWLLARWRDGRVIRSSDRLVAELAGLPLSLLTAFQTPAVEASARTIGLRSLADLLRLPRNGLARRFGKGLLHEIDQLLGQQPDLRPCYHPPARFESRIELLCDVTNAEALIFAIRRQLTALSGWLAARHAGIRELRIDAEHDRQRRENHRPVTRIEARFASPTRELERMLAVIRERLALTRLPAPVHTLNLVCDAILPSGDTAMTLFPSVHSSEEQLGRLLERLQARLGAHQVQRIHLAADHRPEAAYRITPLRQPPAATRAMATALARTRTEAEAEAGASTRIGTGTSASDTGHSPLAVRTPRPLWLLQQPLPLSERNQQPWRNGPLRLISGPERIEGGWWDQQLIQRDYFIAEDDQAQWLWIYRTRGQNSAAPEQTGQWFLQGMFG